MVQNCQLLVTQKETFLSLLFYNLEMFPFL